MKQPTSVPQVVRDSLRCWGKRHAHKTTGCDGVRVEIALDPEVRWDHMNGCYFFWYAGMYHGVEVDGHIHT